MMIGSSAAGTAGATRRGVVASRTARLRSLARCVGSTSFICLCNGHPRGVPTSSQSRTTPTNVKARSAGPILAGENMHLQRSVEAALARGPRTIKQLQLLVGAREQSVRRALRKLKKKGVAFPSPTSGNWALTGVPLRHGNENGVRRVTVVRRAAAPLLGTLASMLLNTIGGSKKC